MKSELGKKIVPFDYFNYREYLSDYFEYSKKTQKYFSHRLFLKKAGIPSPSFLLKIFNGQQRLVEKHIIPFSKALSLSDKETVYFTALVIFNNTKSAKKRYDSLLVMMKIRKGFPQYVISDERLKIFSKWYYPIVRELAVIVDFKEDYNKLGRLVVPRLNAAQARGAVKFLINNGFLNRKPGGFVRVEPVLSTGDDVISTILTEYHKNNLAMNVEDFDLFEIDERDISSLVLSVSENNFNLIREEIRLFRQKLLSIAVDDPEAEKVCYVGFQLVPRSKSLKGDSDETEK